jgi:uncharacterized integral membrane protein (TIGR00697 family)
MISSKNYATLYQVISAAFCVIVVVSNIISAKMVKLPFFEDFIIPAGLVTYPFTFLLSNFVTEMYGKPQARQMVYIALGMNVLTFGIIQMALMLPAHNAQEQSAFQAVMGLGGLRIFSSLTAYTIAQIVDIQLYALIKRWTGTRFLWLRNNGSTWVSQLVDTVVIDIIFLYWGLGMGMDVVLPIMLFSYIYKALFSVANTPLLYLLVYVFKGRFYGLNTPKF